MRSRQYLGLLLLAAVVGAVVSVCGWAFLYLVHEMQPAVYDDLPDALGFDGAPVWWPLPVLALAGLVTALAITRLPGHGGHVPVEGLSSSPTAPISLPGVMLAAFASIGLGAVVGPEAPLIALGSGLAVATVAPMRRTIPPRAMLVIAASGSFAAISLIFGSPLIAAVFMIEAAGIGGPTAPVVLLPGLLAAGVGSLVYIGLGSWSGLDSSAYAIEAPRLAEFARPEIEDFGWTIALAVAIALGAVAITWLGRRIHGVVRPRILLLTPLAGLAVGGLAIAFGEATDHGADEVLFSGQESLSGLVEGADEWSVGALLLLLLFKGLAWSLSLAAFRGGPVFPALLLGAAAGILAARLPGFELTPAVAVGIGAAIASVLRLPISAVLLAVLLTLGAGLGASPLIVVAVVVAYLLTNLLSRRPEAAPAPATGDRPALPV
jgi:H+/Cl- antiporter ClcA